MERLSAYGYETILALVLLASLVLIAQTAMLCRSIANLSQRRIHHALPDVAALLLALYTTLLLGGSWSLIRIELPPDGWLLPQRWGVGIAAIVIGCTACERRLVPSLLIGAGILSLPPLDRLLPMSALLVLGMLTARLLLLAVRTQRQRSRTVTADSIRAGLDLMPDGLLFARADHSAVLVNIAMLHFMERLCGRQYRNAAVFWRDLLAFDTPAVAEKELREDAVLFRFAAGDVWLVQRVQLAGDLDGWQLTASCVTELDAVTRELAAKNEALTNMIGAQKDLLARFEKAERHRALHEITSRVHDILGQRISMLQQLLASAAPKDALDTIVRIDSLLESVPLAQEAHPATLLADMTDTYRRLGIHIALTGELPRNLRHARAFAAIIREALSNAVCHGRTNAVTITLTERRLRVSDNGIGCVALRPGGGLTGMIRRVNELGGHLRITTSPHFELDAQIGEKQDD
ncbi:ATP-binding protein [uncultured Selenomonas sp.]|uniref:sensor histidine kinase n=1 Tax=uncultured Selenomonas sp. TaxID=159275 RepID=UPI0028E74BC3|nr:ATP-binding protein [uncultured Selenomonas sp.]